MSVLYNFCLFLDVKIKVGKNQKFLIVDAQHLIVGVVPYELVLLVRLRSTQSVVLSIQIKPILNRFSS